MKSGRVSPDARVLCATTLILSFVRLSEIVVNTSLVIAPLGAGILVFDETFAQLDNENLEYSVDMLKGIKVNHTFIVSHAENFPYYDNTIITNFNKNTGTTKYNMN